MPPVVYDCPGCGRPVLDDEDYVIAREFRRDEVLAHGFGDPRATGVRPPGVERRFHVQHFRGQIGVYFYELTRTDSLELHPDDEAR